MKTWGLVCLYRRGEKGLIRSWSLHLSEVTWLRGVHTSASKRGSWQTSLMLTGSPVEATSSAMLLLMSQSEHDSFSMLMWNRKQQIHSQSWAFKGILIQLFNFTQSCFFPLYFHIWLVCVCFSWCLCHLMSWSMLHSGDMSSNVFENFTTCVRDTYHHKVTDSTTKIALCTGKARWIRWKSWDCERVRWSRRSDRWVDVFEQKHGAALTLQQG